jgi:hypothetical protein
MGGRRFGMKICQKCTRQKQSGDLQLLRNLQNRSTRQDPILSSVRCCFLDQSCHFLGAVRHRPRGSRPRFRPCGYWPASHTNVPARG